MFESHHLRTSEWLPMGLGIVSFLLLGTVLLTLLAAIRFPRFRVLLLWCIAVAIRPERFEQDSVAHEIAWGLKRWLKNAAPLPVAPLSVEQQMGEVHAAEVHASEPAENLTDNPASNTISEEPLRIGEAPVADKREASVLRYLHRRAVGTPYADYLPCAPERWHGGASATVGQDDNYGDGPWYTATQIRQRYDEGVAGQHVAWMFNRMLEILGFVHRQGIVHGAVLPQHLWFNTESHGLRLVHWRSATKIGKPLSVVPQRYRVWFPADAPWVAGPGLDIFMAANCAMFLAGRRVGSKQIPSALPNPVGQFLRACLLESPSMRPDDAWELHRDARELFAIVFGPPEFHRLSMRR
ncbi:hypothetical protein UC8_16370 [Roseimaritima ulvae]|uniref:Protein kinase domain-containing protein n=2 Tax=Roseimaritima ulvae TaxID=980254 RepID=A0A5B9R052_9BACT|nr:hypothetical protein UC8_16370 [Roseimaritima ulvae]